MKLEPGDIFVVDVDGKTYSVKALSLRGKIAVVSILRELETAGADGFQKTLDALAICTDEAESIAEKVSEEQAIAIITKTVEGQSLSEDEQKK